MNFNIISKLCGLVLSIDCLLLVSLRNVYRNRPHSFGSMPVMCKANGKNRQASGLCCPPFHTNIVSFFITIPVDLRNLRKGTESIPVLRGIINDLLLFCKTSIAFSAHHFIDRI